jgi:hypothetical protein
MALPVAANTTCDIYHAVNGGPPNPPDIAGVACYLAADYVRRMETGESEQAGTRYSHTMLVDAAVDVHDGFSAFPAAGSTGDNVYVPNKNGTKLVVRFVELHRTGSFKKVYLDRAAPAWPTNDL